MGLAQLSMQDLKNKINQNKLVLVDFYADWCGPCRQLTPILETLSSESKGEFEIFKVDVDQDEYRDFTSQYMIMSIPTVLFFKNGKMVHHFIGLYDKGSILEMIAAHR